MKHSPGSQWREKSCCPMARLGRPDSAACHPDRHPHREDKACFPTGDAFPSAAEMLAGEGANLACPCTSASKGSAPDRALLSPHEITAHFLHSGEVLALPPRRAAAAMQEERWRESAAARLSAPRGRSCQRKPYAAARFKLPTL